MPAGLLAWKIFTHGVNVPYMDQWRIADVVTKAFEGRLSLWDLTAQQNESRLFFPCLFFIGLASLTGYDVRYEMWATFGLACLMTYNVYRLGRRTLDSSRTHESFLLFLACLLIFSLVQWENWFWGIQFIVLVPVTCILLIVSLAYSSLSIRTKFVISAALATISTFSYANGILCWIVVFPVLLMQTWNSIKENRGWIALWVSGFAVNFALYFYNYVKPPYHPSFTEGLQTPLTTLSYFLVFLGMPLSGGTVLDRRYQAAIVGGVLCILFVVACGLTWRHRHATNIGYRTAGWLTLGSYTFISAAVTTLGRIGLGFDTALSSRYGAFSLPLLVALVYLVPIYLSVQERELQQQHATWKVRSGATLGTLLILLHLFSTAHAQMTVNAAWRHRVQGKALLLFIDVLPRKWLEKGSFPDLRALTRYAQGLDRHGLLSPRLRKTLTIERSTTQQASQRGIFGWFDELHQTEPGIYLAKGWATLPYRREIAHGIALAYEEADRSWTIFDLIEIRTVRLDVVAALQEDRYTYAGWEHSFRLPPTDQPHLTITAWAIDANSGDLFQLPKTYRVDTQTGEIHVEEG
ncbi:MAG: hypothetical protein AB7G75_09450 [Candidatus Binatia bacterium]